MEAGGGDSGGFNKNGNFRERLNILGNFKGWQVSLASLFCLMKIYQPKALFIICPFRINTIFLLFLKDGQGLHNWLFAKSEGHGISEIG